MNSARQKQVRETGNVPETWKLMERLLDVQKRKRAFDGHGAGLPQQYAHRQSEAERRGERDR